MKYAVYVGSSPLPWAARASRAFVQRLDLLTGRADRAWWFRLRALHGPLLVLGFGLLGFWSYWQRTPVTADFDRSDRLAPPDVPAEGAAQQAVVDRSILQAFNRSQLFEPRQSARPRPATQRNVTLAELSRNLELQAIVGGSSPRAIINNRATNQSHQVGTGQFIGEIEVVEIGSTTVVLRWKEETLELSL